jgi:hypothetical protein
MTNPNRISPLVYAPAASGAGTPLNIGSPWINQAIAVANGIGTQWLAMSTFTDSSGNSVDPTGVTDSWAAFSSAVALCAQAIANGTPLAIWVDCPLRIAIGTNQAKTIFLGNGMTIRCQPGVGYFITDAVLLHLFDMVNMTDITFIDLDILYVGTFGVTAIDAQNQASPIYYTIEQYNDVYGKGFMASPKIGGIQQWAPVTFAAGTGASYYSPGGSNCCALINISGGCDRIAFLGRWRLRVPDGAPACNFIPFCLSGAPNWAPGSSISGTPTITNNNGGVSPKHVYVEDAIFDGLCMGICGTIEYLEIGHLRGVRYSDIQDANGNNIGGQCFDLMTLATAPVAGGTTVTLATPWGYKAQNTVVALSNGTTMSAAFPASTSGSPSTVTLSSYNGGPATIPAGTYTTTLAVQWSQNWFAPPHLLYVHSYDTVFSFPMTVNAGTIYDEGIYVGSPNTRNTGSGYINSVKIEVANGTSIAHCTSLRPHGGLDFLSFNNANGTITKFYCQLNSTIYQQQTFTFTAALSSASSGTLFVPWRYATGSYAVTFSNGSVQQVALVYGQQTASWATAVTATAVANIVNTAQASGFVARFPSSPPIQGVSIDMEWIDLAAVPVAFPIQGDTQFGNTGVTIKSSGVVQDYPLNATYTPCFSMGGQNINVDSTTIFINCSSLKTYVGVQNGLAVQSNFKYTFIGFRATQLLFTGTTISGSGGTLQTPFPYPAGSYEIGFSDGENRNVTFTANQTAITWSPALTNTVTNVASISLMNGTNFAAQKPRIIASNGGLSYGNRLELIDTTNSYSALCENNLLTETFVQDFQGTISGSPCAVPMTLPAGYAIDRWGFNVTGAPTGTGVTGLNFGTAATPTLINNGGGNTISIGASAQDYAIPAHTPINYPGPVALQITPIGGTLTGGTVDLAVSVKGTSMAG